MNARPVADAPVRPGIARTLGHGAGLAVSLAVYAAAAGLLWARVGIPILSLDDIFRTVFAHEWAVAPYLFTERLVWLPFPLIVTGVAMRLTGEAFWTALAVNVAASAVAIACIHRLTERLFGGLAAWVAASLFGLTPWVLFLSLSRHGEPVMFAATAIGVSAWLSWSERGRGRDLAVAALALTAAVMSRYEAWPLTAAWAAHVGVTQLFAGRSALLSTRRPGWPGLWAWLPVFAMATWVGKNLVVYGHPVYGGAFGFLPSVAPPGVWAGTLKTAQHLWAMSPAIVVLGLLGAALHGRRVPLLCVTVALALFVPWYTVSEFPVEVALQARLMAGPLMLLAPFAGAFVAKSLTPRLAAVALAVTLVGAQLAYDVRLRYPSPPLAMTSLALALARSGDLERFDALYVQSDHERGLADEVRVGTNFRRPVRVLSPSVSWSSLTADGPHAVLILNEQRVPPVTDAFVVARARDATAWGVCPGLAVPDARAEWLDVRAPGAIAAGRRATLDVTVRNAGQDVWRPDGCGISLFHRWLGSDGQVAATDSWTAIRQQVEPGRTVALQLPIAVPASPGLYTLEIGLGARRSPSPSRERYRASIRVTGG